MKMLTHFLVLLLQVQSPPIILVPLPARPEIPASVDGVVFDSETRQPLAGATVTLVDRTHSGGRIIAVTSDDGRFAVRGIPPGMYEIEASRSGYVSELAGDPPVVSNVGPNPLAPAIAPVVKQLAPGQVVAGLRFVLTPGGVITGRLTDERGEIVTGTVVQALKVTHRNGLRERTLVQSVVSNDLGEYRFFMLKPGQYYISVVPTTLFAETAPTQSFSLPLFHPGTIDVSAATVIDLRVGQTIESVNFLSIPVKNRRITGGVQGHGNNGVTVILSPANGTASKRFAILSTDPNRPFEFSDIVAGTYMLVATNADTQAVIPLDVRNADLLGTRILLGANFAIPTRARIEGHPPADDPELEKIYFKVRQDVEIPGLENQLYSPFADGKFVIEVLARDYWIEIAQTEGYYIKSATLDGVDVLNQGLHPVSSVDGPLEIIVDSHFGEVQGSTAWPNVTVVLVPDSVRRNQRGLYKSFKSPNGGFYFQNVPPGDYKVFAWSEDTIDNGGPWLDAEYLRRYEERATPVSVQADRKTIVDRLIPVF